MPCSEQIKNVADEVDPSALSPVFERVIGYAQENGIVEQYKVLDDGVLIALDGVQCFSSENIHCEHCLHKTKTLAKGKVTTQYYHNMLAAVVVKPECRAVLPLMPTFIRNEDGQEKQDCERNAAKRWLEEHGDGVKPLKPTFLGDDLFACHAICKAILGKGMSFLFTCKPESHPRIYEQIKDADFQECRHTVSKGRERVEYRYKWLSGIENRADGERLLVNYLSLEIWNPTKDNR